LSLPKVLLILLSKYDIHYFSSMKKFFQIFFVCLGLSLFISSCTSSSEDDTVYKQTIPGCFIYVEDLTSAASAYYTNVSYDIKLNYTKATAEVLVTNLKLTDGTVYPSLRLSDMPFRIANDGWIEVIADKVKPDKGSFGGEVEFSSFKMRIYQRIVNQSYLPAVYFRYTVNQHFSVVSSTPHQLAWGTTTSTDQDGKSFSTTDTYYEILLNTDTRCATIYMNKANFISTMPALDIMLRDVPFVIAGGRVVIEAANIIPYIGGTPYMQFPITNLSGAVDLEHGFSMSFDCTPATVAGSVFHVKADTSFTPLTNNK